MFLKIILVEFGILWTQILGPFGENLPYYLFICILVFQVFHKIITTGHQRLQPLFDCLLTIIVNGKNDKILKF